MKHALRACGAPAWTGGDTWGRQSRTLGVSGLVEPHAGDTGR